MGVCYYCGRPATKQMEILHNGTKQYHCDQCYDSAKKVSEGKNKGMGAGIM